MGIDISNPGFYDEEQFMALERTNANLLDNYASFIDQKVFAADYLAHSGEIIEKTAFLLHRELQRDGRKGACIDVSMALSRILEKEGIWNYQVKGSLTITFPRQMGLHPKFFWSVAHGNYAAAHSWLIAPPYRVVDVTVREQPYKHGEDKVLPVVVLSKETELVSVNLEDIIESNILADLKRKFGHNKKKIMNYISPNLDSFTKRFRPEVYQQDDIQFKYSPTGIVAADLPFEKATSLKLNGLYGIAIYNKVIKPILHNATL